MTTSKSLPHRPSLESLRKQAKKLARDIDAGDKDAIARAQLQLPNIELPLTQRNAQLVIAREYGYTGWQELTAEVSKRLGKGLDWAVTQSRQVIHNNDVEGPSNEQHFTRVDCAEALIDAGAVVMPSVCEEMLSSRARGLLQMFQRKGLLPRVLKFFAALGDIDAVRTALYENENDLPAVTEAFTSACSFEHEPIASLLLDEVIAHDPELGALIDRSVGRLAFARYFIDNRPGHATELGLWKAFVMEHVKRAVYSWSGSETSLKDRRGDSDLPAFVELLQRESWLLGEDFVEFQTEIIQRAALQGRGEFITALLDLNPAILRCQPPPTSQAIEFAFTYANAHVIPVLKRIWPVPDDLPHAAGMAISRV